MTKTKSKKSTHHNCCALFLRFAAYFPRVLDPNDTNNFKSVIWYYNTYTFKLSEGFTFHQNCLEAIETLWIFLIEISAVLLPPGLVFYIHNQAGYRFQINANQKLSSKRWSILKSNF